MDVGLLRRRAALGVAAAALAIVAAYETARGPVARAGGVDLVRLDGILGTNDAPGTIVQTTLAIGSKSVPFSVLAAQRISGDPFNGPGVLLALGPGPPPIRIEGRDETVGRLMSAPPGTRAVLVGNLQVGMALLTLMSVEITPSASPSAGSQ
jgi:hypothetical protein